MRIPDHAQGFVKQLGLRSWVDHKNFPHDEFFALIDANRQQLIALLPTDDEDEDGTVPDDCLVNALVGGLRTHRRLRDHVQGKVEWEGQEEYERICAACGWVILQAYYRAIKKGDWPK